MRTRDSFKYCPSYCEENIWHMCNELFFADSNSFAVFISNPTRTVPFANQRAAGNEPGIYWDYHVVILQEDSGWLIYDLDSTLEFPCPAGQYLIETFPFLLNPKDLPLFRVIPASEYRSSFASDRRHMRDADGAYLQPPPTWPPILTETQQFNLWDFVDMECEGLGKVYTLGELLQMCSGLK